MGISVGPVVSCFLFFLYACRTALMNNAVMNENAEMKSFHFGKLIITLHSFFLEGAQSSRTCCPSAEMQTLNRGILWWMPSSPRCTQTPLLTFLLIGRLGVFKANFWGVPPYSRAWQMKNSNSLYHGRADSTVYEGCMEHLRFPKNTVNVRSSK